MAVDMDMVVVDVVLDYLRLSSAKNFSISFEFSLTHYYSFASLPHTHTHLGQAPRIYDYHGFTIQLTLFALRVALIYFHLIQFCAQYLSIVVIVVVVGMANVARYRMVFIVM